MAAFPYDFDTTVRVRGKFVRVFLEDADVGIAEMPLTTVNADTTLDETTAGHMIEVNTTDADRVITAPPSAENLHRKFWVIKNGQGANRVNVVRSGANTIGGGNGPITLNAGEWAKITLDHDNTNWGTLVVRQSAAAQLTTASINAPTTIAPENSGTLYDTDVTAGDITQPLPDPTSVPQGFIIGFKLKSDDSGNALILQPAAGQIDERPSMRMTENNAAMWFGILGNQWVALYDYNPANAPESSSGTLTINPGTPVTTAHNLGVRPVNTKFVRVADNVVATLSEQQPDNTNFIVDGSVAGDYLWRATI